jgi:prolyl-tRNA synthetase
MGALIMAHSDDEGLVLPPKLAPIQVVIVPIFKKDEEKNAIAEVANKLKKSLKNKHISVRFDDRDTHKPGFKFAEWELKGVPLRIAIGPRDLENGTVELARRDTKEKETVSIEGIESVIETKLNEIQESIYNNALNFRNEKTTKVDSYEEFKKVLEEKGGFVSAHWDGTPETEEKIKQETKATIRCIPLDAKEEAGKCIYSGKPSNKRVLFAKAY